MTLRDPEAARVQGGSLPSLAPSERPPPVSSTEARRPGSALPVGIDTRVVSSRRLTPTAHAIQIEKPAGIAFAPTQFTFLQLLTDHGIQARPMSLATSPTRQHMEYAVRLSDSPFKRAFAGLRPGDELQISAPRGDFLLAQDRPAVLIAGGIGITPFKGMAEYAADLRLPTPIRLLLSNPSEQEIVFRDELEALERDHAPLEVIHTLTQRAGRDWQGWTGRIDAQLLRSAAADLEDPLFYISGTPSLVRSMWRLLREAGIPAANVRVEAFRGYAHRQ